MFNSQVAEKCAFNSNKCKHMMYCVTKPLLQSSVTCMLL